MGGHCGAAGATGFQFRGFPAVRGHFAFLLAAGNSSFWYCHGMLLVLVLNKRVKGNERKEGKMRKKGTEVGLF
jgi:hypothetical protein